MPQWRWLTAGASSPPDDRIRSPYPTSTYTYITVYRVPLLTLIWQSYVVLSRKIDAAIVELRNEMHHSFDRIDRRIDRMDHRIDGLDERLRGVEVQVATLAGPAPPVPVGTSDR